MLLAAVFALYGFALGKELTSEDFLILRILAHDGSGQDLLDQFRSPWLGLSALVKFYRPVSTVFLAAEARLMGVSPLGLNVAHVLVHALSAWLLFKAVWLMAGKGSRAVPLGAALLFAAYPLHPNAVLFVASFSNLFSAALILGSLVLHLKSLDAGAPALRVGSLLLFLLALGCYEGAVILPALLLAHEVLLVPGRNSGGMAGRVRRQLPYLVILAGYFPFRRQVLGETIAGYSELRARFDDPAALLSDAVGSFFRILYPDFGADAWQPPLLLVGVILAAVVTMALVAARRGIAAPYPRLVLFGLSWVVIAQIPFAFSPVIPFVGRFWYLASAGLAFAILSLVPLFAYRLEGAIRPAAGAVTLILGALWVLLLHGNLVAYLEGGRATRTIRTAVADAEAGTGLPVFVAGTPLAITNDAGALVAPAYQYGLADSVMRPFRETDLAAFPLPTYEDPSFLPVVRSPHAAKLVAWDKESRSVRALGSELTGRSFPGIVEMEVVEPADEQLVTPTTPYRLRALPPGAQTFRLVVALPEYFIVQKFERPDSGEVTGLFPHADIAALAPFYGRDLYWWIEARDSGNSVVAFTRMLRLRR